MSRMERALDYARIAAGHGFERRLERVTDPIVITEAALDQPGPRMTYVNAAFEALTGYPRDRLLGQTPRMLQGYDTDQAELARMKAALLAEDRFEGDVLNYASNGREYVMGWSIVPLRDAAGMLRGWLAVQNDVLNDARGSRSR